MKAFLVTSPKFSGTAEVVYNHDGVLIRIDTANTNLQGVDLEHFKRAVCADVAGLTSRFGADTIFVESAFEITFEMWFNKYDLKLDKERARKLWDNLSKTARARCYYSVEPYDRYLKRKKGIEKMYPKTFLSSKAWETDWDKIK